MSSRSPDQSQDYRQTTDYSSDGQLVDELETNTSLISNSEIDWRFPIYVETMTATTFKLDVFPTDTIHQIKEQLEYSEGIAMCEQHLIWKYQELSDQNTVHHYRIPYGARLKLIVDLMTGPVSRRTIDVNDQEIDEQTPIGLVSEDKHFTIILLRSRDRIKAFSMGSNVSDQNRNNYFSKETDFSQTINNEMLDSRQEEDKQLKNKMNDIQQKLESLRLKRNKNNCRVNPSQSKGSPNSQTITNLNINSSNKTEKQTKFSLHLPPISKESNFKDKPLNKSSDVEKEFNLIKQILKPSIATNTPLLKRRQTLASIKTINFDKEVNRSDLLNNNCDNNLICERKPSLRPLTAPIVNNVKDKETNLRTNSTKIKLEIQTNLLPQRNGSKTRRSKSGRRLPPIMNNPKKKVNKIRCNFCRNKLTIINRFKCRCGLTFCAKHRYSETHFCSFDYKQEGKEYLAIKNQLVLGQKLPKI